MIRGEDAKKNSCDPLYGIDLTEVHRKDVEFWRKDDFGFRPEPGSSLKGGFLEDVYVLHSSILQRGEDEGSESS